MVPKDDLDTASGQLERVFFGGDNAPLLAELRRKSETEQRLDLLRDAVKIQDDAFVQRLATLGVRPETAVAVTVVPLVLVAWADGKLDERERDAILQAARQRGLTAEQITERLLRNGLARPPDPRLFRLWTGYVRRLWGCFTAQERWQMRSNLLQSAREVAEAAGGILGLTSKISAGERRVLDELASILD